LSKPSIVFVHDAAATSTGHVPVIAQQPPWTLLPAGTRLVARLQSAVSTAVKAPVVAVIEYNYEHDGMVVVPAGSRAFGELQQASSTGQVAIRFHSLQPPDARAEGIEAVAVGLDLEPIKGHVGGSNRGKKVLVRSLTGIGTMAAYLVGGRGGFSGLGGPINQSVLLRERIASNLALAGEQELMNLAYNQNLVVTVPGNLRFYIVLQQPPIGEERSGPAGRAAVPPGTPPLPTAAELRELVEFKRELNRMYQTAATGDGDRSPDQ
jgi:hypothetical protein